jgi:hypothetical protein
MADVKFNRLTVDSLVVGDPLGANVFVTPESLTLHGRRGKPLAYLHSHHDVLSLSLHDHNRQARIKLTIDDHGQPEITVADANGKSRLLLTVDEEGSPSIALQDTTGANRFESKLLDGESPSLAFHDKDEELRFHLLLQDDEASMLAFPSTGEQRWHYELGQLAKKGRA